MATKDSEAKKPEPENASDKNTISAASQSEFLVVGIGEKMEKGDQLKLIDVADSVERAKKVIDDLPSDKPTRVAILEKKQVFRRRPVIEATAVSDNIIGESLGSSG